MRDSHTWAANIIVLIEFAEFLSKNQEKKHGNEKSFHIFQKRSQPGEMISRAILKKNPGSGKTSGLSGICRNEHGNTGGSPANV